MKNIYFLCAMIIALLQSNVTNAQEEKIRDFNAKNALEFVMYDANEVCDEAKVKEDGKRQLVTKAITEYNSEMEQFSFQHALTLNDIEFMVNMKQKEAIESKNYEAMKELRFKLEELLAPHLDLLKKSSTKLNETLKKVLSEKEFKRWTKYSEKKKEALNPKPPSANNAMPQRGMNNGQQRGLGRGQQRYY